MKLSHTALLLTSLVVTGCASLSKSQLDSEMRIQGTYSCPPVTVSRPANENPDSTVVRCFQDSVVVMQDELVWHRVLYDRPGCSGDVHGSLEWKASNQVLMAEEDRSSGAEVTVLEVGRVQEPKMVRRNPHWYFDSKGGRCDLRQVPVNAQLAPSGKSTCEKFFPPPLVAENKQKIRFLGEEREGTKNLVGHWNGKEVACSR